MKLIVVDKQHDFCNPFGKLYVNGAELRVPVIEQAIRSGEFDEVIFTVDWHTPADKSFIPNGGPWKPHCCQYSVGAAIMPGLIEAVVEMGISYQVFLKGDNPEHEEYGAFEKKRSAGENVILYNFSKTSKVTIPKDTEFVVAGVAGDYCVVETLKNLIKLGFSPKVFMAGIEFIDKESNVINELGLETWEIPSKE
ncbi:MAG: isochorismatase family protein [Bacilli bacterium]|nr:isochorismatase family protein [Bacilli bacterium]